MNQTRLFPTTVVGSLPRPQWVLDLFQRRWDGGISEEEFQQRLDNAVLFAIQLQDMAGIDIITDGEYRRESYVKIFAQRVSGFERDALDGSAILDDGNYFNPRSRQVLPPSEAKSPLRYPAVVQPIQYDQPLVLNDSRFLLANTSRPVKVTLPSPYILARRLWHPDFSHDAYPTREDFLEAILPILKEECRRLQSEGVHFIQLDDPWLSLFVDEGYRDHFEEVEREIHLSMDSINRVVEGLNVKTGVHFCRAHYNRQTGFRGDYSYLMPFLKELKVSQLVMEFALPNAGSLEVLENFPEEMELGLGCVDVRAVEIPDPDQIVGMVKEACRYVDKERITLNPDCGFAPSHTNPIPPDEAYLKLRAMAEAAQRLRNE